MGREVDGVNPGSGYVRIALVAEEEQVQEAARRIVRFGSASSRPASGPDEPLLRVSIGAV